MNTQARKRLERLAAIADQNESVVSGLKSAVETLAAERDEARREVERLSVLDAGHMEEIHGLDQRVNDLDREHGRLAAERDEALAQLTAIREMVGAQNDESTVDAVQYMATEWTHYSKEMNHAGYVTIPTLTAERDAALGEVERLKAAAIRVHDFSGHKSIHCYFCRLKADGEDASKIEHFPSCPLRAPLGESPS
jgi:chromosome segregation ATPase